MIGRRSGVPVESWIGDTTRAPVSRVVAVFGGGGAKSLAHAGAWKALLELGLRPAHIVGTSMGAVIGAALAAGSTYQRIVDIALSLQKKDSAALDAWSLAKGVFAGNILKPDPLKRTIARLVPATRFGDMQIPLTVTATDLDSGELVLFGALGQDAPLVDALYASCALPLYLPPEVIDGHRLGDGGLRAVVPLDVARRIPADMVVAVDGGPGCDERRGGAVDARQGYLGRAGGGQSQGSPLPGHDLRSRHRHGMCGGGARPEDVQSADACTSGYGSRNARHGAGGIQDRAAGRQRHAYTLDDCGSGRDQESRRIYPASEIRSGHCHSAGEVLGT